MFGYLRRKLFKNGTSTPKSERATLKDIKTESNAGFSSQESNQSNRTDAANDLSGIVVQRETAAIPDLRSVNLKHDHSSSELVISKISEINEIQDIKPVEKFEIKDIIYHKNKTREMPEVIRNDPAMKNYWDNRYKLFSKYDKGIKLTDAQSWYSVTPEKISKEIAQRCHKCDVIIDPFCGAGGNIIQFAFVCKKVIAIDIDAGKIELAKHNAEIYGLADKIEFIVGDSFQLAPSLKADAVFLSPPWGGPSYKLFQDYHVSQIMEPYGGELVYNTAKQISRNIVYFLPKNIIASEVAALEPEEYVRIEKKYLDDGMAYGIAAYFGDLAKD